MKLFQRLLLIWMIAWLPAAGALAAVMPLSGPLAVFLAPDGASNDGDGLTAMPCHGADATAPACSHCVLCDLAGALMMPVMSAVANLVPPSIFSVAPHFPHPSFIPEPAYPPPRASAA